MKGAAFQVRAARQRFHGAALSSSNVCRDKLFRRHQLARSAFASPSRWAASVAWTPTSRALIDDTTLAVGSMTRSVPRDGFPSSKFYAGQVAGTDRWLIASTTSATRALRTMPRKLQTYVTSAGFFDLAVAAPSMKAALEAWGSTNNRFHQGFAKVSNDPDIIKATTGKPGTILRRRQTPQSSAQLREAR